jgi:hypothetical protein
MRVKIGNTWYGAKVGQPVMVELEPQDRINIAGMPPDAHYYAVFDDAEPTTKDEKYAWMAEGARHRG